MSALAGTEVKLSVCMTKIVRATEAAAGGQPIALIGSVALGALRHTKIVTRLLAIREKGGPRAAVTEQEIARRHLAARFGYFGGVFGEGPDGDVI